MFFKQWCLAALVGLLFSSLTSSVLAEEVSSSSEPLRFSVWNDADAPYAIREQDTLKSGLIKDIGDELASYLHREASYKILPVKRVEVELDAGRLDATCVTHPQWWDKPDNLIWSEPLFSDGDSFIVPREYAEELDSLDAMKGFQVGVYQGYRYHPEVEARFSNGELIPVVVPNINKAIELLQVGRLNAHIEFERIALYQIAHQSLQDKLALASVKADSFELSCAFHPRLKPDLEGINAHIREIRENGRMAQILSAYGG